MPIDPELPDQRSADRQSDPPCPRCQSPDPMRTLRTKLVLYYRCAMCGEIWTVNKPLVTTPVG